MMLTEEAIKRRKEVVYYELILLQVFEIVIEKKEVAKYKLSDWFINHDHQS